jgi:ferredoxin--NADP+ reductase
MTALGTPARPLRVAIVGSGPSGFYAAESLFRSDADVRVDMFDRLPTPYGLVRGGVAPDHHKIKAVIKKYSKIASDERFSFLGNVEVGEHITIDELSGFYDAVLLSVGAETDRKLGIPGEDLRGSYTATEFVGWYNGHPDYRDREFDLSQEVAVVIGQGNVAMDVTRILAKTVDELSHTDIAEHALDALAESKVKEIHLVGRRGPVQAKFTAPEIREMGELADCDPVLDVADLELNEASQAELDDKDAKGTRENFEILKAFGARGEPTKSRRCVIHFYKSPIELLGDSRLQQVKLETNRLEGEAFRQKARGTGEHSTLDAGLLFRSVGYRGVPLKGAPFRDDWGLIPNDLGRVQDKADGDVIKGLYVAGWIKRGPSGVIGTNKPDSVETVKCLLEDMPELQPCATPDTGSVVELLKSRGQRVVSFADWQKIDAAEVARGEAKGKPREKFTRLDEMLEVLKG